jgi:succinoglycan biosynthesis protein ExoO
VQYPTDNPPDREIRSGPEADGATPEVTVLIAAWNAEATLGRAVESALSQTGVTLEVLIVDDASTDGTRAVAAALVRTDPRVRLIALARNGGPAQARNAGIEAGRGQWLAVLDADDAFAPGRLARLIAFARQRQADVVADNMLRVDGKGMPLREARYLSADRFGTPQRWDLRLYSDGNLMTPRTQALGYLKPLIRRDVLDAQGLRYDAELRNGEDYMLIAELLARGAVAWFLPEPGYLYTVHRGSSSARLDPEHGAALLDADRAFLSRLRAERRIDGSALGALDRRHRTLVAMISTETVMRLLRAGHVARASTALCRQPGLLPIVARQMAEAASKRVAARWHRLSAQPKG